MERPDAIIITIPSDLIKHYPYGEKGIRRILETINVRPDGTWSNTIANIPKIEVPWCYICFLGGIHYRMNIVQFEKNVSKEFNDGGIIREFKNKNWVTLTGPVITAPPGILHKGFQGFRYTQKLF